MISTLSILEQELKKCDMFHLRNSKKLGLFCWNTHEMYKEYYTEFYYKDQIFHWALDNNIEIRRQINKWQEWRGTLEEIAEMWDKKFWRLTNLRK